MNILQFISSSSVRSAFMVILFWIIGYLMHRFIADRYKAPFWLRLLSGLPRKDSCLSQTGTVIQFFGMISILPRSIPIINRSPIYGQIFILGYLIIGVCVVIILKRSQTRS